MGWRTAVCSRYELSSQPPAHVFMQLRHISTTHQVGNLDLRRAGEEETELARALTKETEKSSREAHETLSRWQCLLCPAAQRMSLGMPELTFHLKHESVFSVTLFLTLCSHLYEGIAEPICEKAIITSEIRRALLISLTRSLFYLLAATRTLKKPRRDG